MIEKIRAWARALKRQLVMAWVIARDPQTSLWLKAWWLFSLGYALSPIDLIPDFIPIIGFLDDAILLPLFLWLGFRWTPKAVVARARASADLGARLPQSTIGAAVIALIWLSVLGWMFWRFCA